MSNTSKCVGVITGVDLSKILGGKTKIFEGAEGGKKLPPKVYAYGCDRRWHWSYVQNSRSGCKYTSSFWTL